MQFTIIINKFEDYKEILSFCSLAAGVEEGLNDHYV